MAPRRPRQKIVESGVQAPRQATPDILDLPGVVTSSHKIVVHKKRRFRFVEAEVTTVQKNCLKCGSDEIRKFGKRKKKYFDCSIRGDPTIINLLTQRFECKRNSCGKTFLQPVDGMDPTRSMTTRCVEWIRERSLRDTFLHVAEHIGCDDKTVREINRTYVRELNKTHHPYLPEWLGIDEIWLGGRYRCVLTDIGKHRPIDLLKNHKKKTVAGWLWNFRENFHHLKGVTMDMSGDFEGAVHAVFKEIPIVVDRFHAVKMANAALDEVRNKVAKKRNKKERRFLRGNKGLLRTRGYKVRKSKGMQQKLDRLLDEEPEIKTAYALKEQFSKIYDLGRKDAAEALKNWRNSVPDNMRGHFKALLTATKNWKKEILAYFDHTPRRTNGYTESLNRNIKDIDRHGRGYDFEILRARILFASADLADQKLAGIPSDDPVSPIISKPRVAAAIAKPTSPIISKPERAAASGKPVSPIISKPGVAAAIAKPFPPIISRPRRAAASDRPVSPIISKPERAGVSISGLLVRMGYSFIKKRQRTLEIHDEQIYDMCGFRPCRVLWLLMVFLSNLWMSFAAFLCI